MCFLIITTTSEYYVSIVSVSLKAGPYRTFPFISTHFPRLPISTNMFTMFRSAPRYRSLCLSLHSFYTLSSLVLPSASISFLSQLHFARSPTVFSSLCALLLCFSRNFILQQSLNLTTFIVWLLQAFGQLWSRVLQSRFYSCNYATFMPLRSHASYDHVLFSRLKVDTVLSLILAW